MKTKLPFKNETEQQKKTRVANEILLYEKKSRAWLETPPKNWTSAILRQLITKDCCNVAPKFCNDFN